MNIKDLEQVFLIASFSNREDKGPLRAWIEKEDIENKIYILYTEQGEHLEFTGFSEHIFRMMIVRMKEYERIGQEGLIKKWGHAYDELERLRIEREYLRKDEIETIKYSHDDIIDDIRKRIEEVKDNPDKAREVIMNCGLYDKNGNLKDQYK